MIWTFVFAILCFVCGLAVARAYRNDAGLAEFSDALITVACLPFRALTKVAATALKPKLAEGELAPEEVNKINGTEVPLGSALLGRSYRKDKDPQPAGH